MRWRASLSKAKSKTVLTEVRRAEEERAKATTEMHGVVGDGMVWKSMCVNQGDLDGLKVAHV